MTDPHLPRSPSFLSCSALLCALQAGLMDAMRRMFFSAYYNYVGFGSDIGGASSQILLDSLALSRIQGAGRIFDSDNLSLPLASVVLGCIFLGAPQCAVCQAMRVVAAQTQRACLHTSNTNTNTGYRSDKSPLGRPRNVFIR